MSKTQPIGMKRWPGLMAALALAGCVANQAPVTIVKNSPIPTTLPETASVDTPASAEARAYYAEVQQGLLAQGLMRTDGGGPDTPVTQHMLVENFLRIALFDEYAHGMTGSVQQQTPSKLRRWMAPVRVAVRFGASVSADKRATDRARVGSYLQRLQELTGHPIGLNEANPNFFVYFVSEDERQALGPVMRAALPELTAADVRSITNLDRSTYCMVYAQSDGGSGIYSKAFAVIRSEHPDLLRLSCMHEEIAQALGLPNDSPLARPSIFNDDEEFALLTKQDEMMLKILYDPALRPGMTEAEARPIVETLASRLLGGES